MLQELGVNPGVILLNYMGFQPLVEVDTTTGGITHVVPALTPGGTCCIQAYDVSNNLYYYDNRGNLFAENMTDGSAYHLAVCILVYFKYREMLMFHFQDIEAICIDIPVIPGDYYYPVIVVAYYDEQLCLVMVEMGFDSPEITELYIFPDQYARYNSATGLRRSVIFKNSYSVALFTSPAMEEMTIFTFSTSDYTLINQFTISLYPGSYLYALL